jgi:oligopeptide transport system ATP-binding protein
MTGALLEAHNVSKHYPTGSTWFGRNEQVRAVHDVTLSLIRGMSLGLVGESGCGKSTLARLLVGLEEPSTGTLSLAGERYPAASRLRRRLISRKVQMVFQDPGGSLNPRKTAEQLLSAPLAGSTKLSESQRLERVREVLELVELAPETLSRYPHELSGGQAQRLAIARALAPGPELIVLDEAVSSLDVSIQARILRLLARLRRELNLSYLFIAHDLAVVEVVCDQIAVMYLGSVVEQGSTKTVLGAPKHPYTRALLSAVPVIGKRTRRIQLAGDPPSPARPPPGCVFCARCYRAEARCREQEPKLEDGRVDHPCACFFAHDSEPDEAAFGNALGFALGRGRT